MDSKKHYQGHRKRLRERLQRNSRELADYEVLELLLGYVLTRQDTKPLAKELLDRFGTLVDVFAARPEELRAIKGFGPALETFWVLWKETWARLHETPTGKRCELDTPQAVAQMAIARLGGASKEEFWTALVDNKNRLLAWEQVSQGTVDRAAVYIREVLSLALSYEASGMILVHNHPGGDLDPSREDLELTKRVSVASNTLGIRLLDHLIVAGSAFMSFQAEGLLG